VLVIRWLVDAEVDSVRRYVVPLNRWPLTPEQGAFLDCDYTSDSEPDDDDADPDDLALTAYLALKRGREEGWAREVGLDGRLPDGGVVVAWICTLCQH
jgi:hypothetical protein